MRSSGGEKKKEHTRGGFENQHWMTFRSAHTTLFIYLQVIVLQAPGSVTKCAS
jgi:hypothetical protein